MSRKNQTLGEFIIENQSEFKYSSGELSKLINAIRLAAKVVNHEVNKAGLVDIIGTAGDTNVQGEDQQKLDVLANQTFIQTLSKREIVCGIASEEEEDFISINSLDENNQNKYVVLIDPLDGSSNIDVNVSVGTIFSVYRRITPLGTPVTKEDFLQPGRNQVAAGYIIYGTSTMISLHHLAMESTDLHLIQQLAPFICHTLTCNTLRMVNTILLMKEIIFISLKA